MCICGLYMCVYMCIYECICVYSEVVFYAIHIYPNDNKTYQDLYWFLMKDKNHANIDGYVYICVYIYVCIGVVWIYMCMYIYTYVYAFIHNIY